MWENMDFYVGFIWSWMCLNEYVFVAFFFFFCLFRATRTAYGGSQARGQIRTVATGLLHNHAKSELRLQPTPQLTATLDP